MNNEYDISQAFQRIEETLIKSMSSNLGRHLREEAKGNELECLASRTIKIIRNI